MLIILCILFVSLLICNYIPPFTMIKNVLSTKLQNLNETTLVFNYYCIFATQRTNNMKYDSPYFEFIENNHPQYYSDDRVLLCDILFRFI